MEELPHKSGIYKITNKINGNVYIGQAVDIYNRYHLHHKYDYKNEKYRNYKIYQAFKKYGIENFKVEVVELCSPKLLDEREIFWIKYYNSFKDGYNGTAGGQYWSPKIHSEETEEKRRETREKNKSLQGENHPRAKLSNSEVYFLRERYIQGESISKIYEDYKDKYSLGGFKRVILGKAYKTVGNIPKKEDIRRTNAVFTKEQVISIRKDYYQKNFTLAELARKYGVTSSTIRKIVDRITYPYVMDNIDKKSIN